MNAHSKGEPRETPPGAGDQTRVTPRHITAEQLLHLGTREVVYLKSAMHDGELSFVLYGADGTAVAAVDDVETAIEMVAKYGLDFVTVH